jgi:hypothetical protein
MPYAVPGAPGAPAQYGQPQPSKKSNTLLFVGIGCGALLLLTVVGAIVVYAMFGSALSGSSTSPTCQKVAACCKRLFQQTGADPNVLSKCDNYKRAPEATCKESLVQYEQSAAAHNLRCE